MIIYKIYLHIIFYKKYYNNDGNRNGYNNPNNNNNNKKILLKIKIFDFYNFQKVRKCFPIIKVENKVLNTTPILDSCVKKFNDI